MGNDFGFFGQDGYNIPCINAQARTPRKTPLSSGNRRQARSSWQPKKAIRFPARKKNPAAVALGKLGGLKGGNASAGSGTLRWHQKYQRVAKSPSLVQLAGVAVDVRAGSKPSLHGATVLTKFPR